MFIFFFFVLAQVWRQERGGGLEVVDTGGLVAGKSRDHTTIWRRPWFGYRLASFEVSPLALFVQEFSRKLDGSQAKAWLIYLLPVFFVHNLP